MRRPPNSSVGAPSVLRALGSFGTLGWSEKVMPVRSVRSYSIFVYVCKGETLAIFFVFSLGLQSLDVVAVFSDFVVETMVCFL